MPGIPPPAECRRLLADAKLDPAVVRHAEAVAALGAPLARALRRRGIFLDEALVEAGCLLHDIGRSRTHGIDHALVGANLLRERGYPESLALCVERHTGGGIAAAEARALGLPEKDYLPRTVEEKVVCQVDNLFDAETRQPVERELEDLRRRGLPHVADRIAGLHAFLSRLLGTDLDRFEG